MNLRVMSRLLPISRRKRSKQEHPRLTEQKINNKKMNKWCCHEYWQHHFFAVKVLFQIKVSCRLIFLTEVNQNSIVFYLMFFYNTGRRWNR